jgi:uncharacterized membrane protein YfcA
MSELAAMAIGLVGGTMAGLMGIGGGILFVPALSIFLDHTHIEAEATSLVAIIPVALVGTWRQAHYGNVRLGEGIWLGLLSPAGVIVGAVVANTVPERALEIAFSVLILFVAYRLVLKALEPEQAKDPHRAVEID